ncbi:helix-turn-helix transcriptional regulator [Halosquirtibacter xylanolyticus]|uniref:helix-turn-helix transcriptional regulator n=1 Tax=Halosquirtibacter xylanolyticus TaxID=3374599 RepID=UPI00374A2B3D|nr:helix-turn-helix transcriptional regulator [Prolixibacteraceae bacterium]
MKRYTINSLESHKDILCNLFQAKRITDSVLELADGIISFYSLDFGIEAIVFDIDQHSSQQKVMIEFGKSYDVQYVLTLYHQNIEIGNDDSAVLKLHSQKSLTIMHSQYGYIVDVSKTQKVSHITFLIKYEAVKNLSLYGVLSVLDDLKLLYVDNLLDLPSLRSILSNRKSYTTELQPWISDSLLRSIFFISLEYIVRRSKTNLRSRVYDPSGNLLDRMLEIQNDICDLSQSRWSLDHLASKYRMSPMSLKKHFKAYFGRSPMKYYQDYRLQYARSMLLSSDYSLQDIAYRCGFSDLPHFSREFKKKYGVSPRDYIEKL